tara:strand:+ start:488 stop:868 length:381 start_codon:yes stop_codon:yes gene_type:complete
MNEKLDLGNFYGTQQYHRINDVWRYWLCTDGVKYVADNAGGGAYWLLDIIVVHGKPFMKKKASMLDITVAVEDGVATIVFGDGNGNKLQTLRDITTDFPEEGITLWVLPQYHPEGDMNIIMLPQEY